jgi:hypothetical protein
MENMTKQQALETFKPSEGGDYKDWAAELCNHLRNIGYPVPEELSGFYAPRGFLRWWHSQ